MAKWFTTNVILFLAVSAWIYVSQYAVHFQTLWNDNDYVVKLIPTLVIIGISLTLLLIVKFRNRFVSYSLRAAIMLTFVMGVNLLAEALFSASAWLGFLMAAVSIGYLCLVVFLIDGEVRGIRHVLGLPSEMAISAEKFSA